MSIFFGNFQYTDVSEHSRSCSCLLTHTHILHTLPKSPKNLSFYPLASSIPPSLSSSWANERMVCVWVNARGWLLFLFKCIYACVSVKHQELACPWKRSPLQINLLLLLYTHNHTHTHILHIHSHIYKLTRIYAYMHISRYTHTHIFAV